MCPSKNHNQNALESFMSFAPKKTSSPPLDIAARSLMMNGWAFMFGESGGVGAVVDDDESWKIISDASIRPEVSPESKGLE